MPESLALADVLARGLELAPHESVALILGLIAEPTSDELVTMPPGPPSPYNVFLDDHGSVTCRGCAATPAVSEVALLLETLLLHRGRLPMPGALRYTVARALLEVDAPPFDSLDDFSSALTRFEQGDRGTVLRLLADRVFEPTIRRVPPAVGVERRRNGASRTDLRRRLREADREVFETQAALRARFPPPATPAPFNVRHSLAALAVAAAAVALTFFGSYVFVGHQLAGRRASLEALPSSSFAAAMSQLPATTRIVRDSASPARDRSSVSYAFASNRTALLSNAARTADAHGAIRSASPLGADLQVMTIADDGAHNYHVQPSPDGARIAFDSDRDGERGVYVANRDGTGVRRITGDGYAALPAWAPDGSRLAFVRAERDRPNVWNLWIISLASGEARQLTHYRDGQTWTASWFRDGQRVCYTHDSEIIVLDLGSGATRAYRSPIPGRLVRAPAVSPDGRHVIFQVARSGAWVVDLADGSMRCALTDPTVEEFAWSPDSRRVAFHSRRDGEWGLWIMAPET